METTYCTACGLVYALAVVKAKLAVRRGKPDKIVGRRQLKHAQRSIYCGVCGGLVYREADKEKKNATGKVVRDANGAAVVEKVVVHGKAGA